MSPLCFSVFSMHLWNMEDNSTPPLHLITLGYYENTLTVVLWKYTIYCLCSTQECCEEEYQRKKKAALKLIILAAQLGLNYI